MKSANDLCWLSATELASKIASGEVLAADALEAVISKYELLNPEINAVVVTQLDEARQRATAADEARALGEIWGPLHGIPMTVKEAFDWTGTPTTWGNPQWADNVAQADAVTVQRLLSAGAVIYGKTNVPLMLSDWQSFNEIYGTTNNPWDQSRVPGGSSGGAAAALATGMATLELGSDIGGSVRNPAHYCGVFGHKPTFGVVPNQGHEPPGFTVPLDIGVCGPLARTTADLELALDVLAGPTGFDAAGYRLEMQPEARDSLTDFRVGVMLDTGVIATSTVMIDALQSAVDRLAEAGADIAEATPDVDQFEYFDNYLHLVRSATSGMIINDDAFAEHKKLAKRYDPARRYGRSVEDLKAIVGHATTMTHREWLGQNETREGYRRAWAEYFDSFDLLLCPAAASTAYEHDHCATRIERTIEVDGNQEPGMDQLFWAGWSCSAYLPSTVAPIGLAADGLPVGIQIVAPHLGDRRSLRYAQLVEQALGGFVPPPIAV